MHSVIPESVTKIWSKQLFFFCASQTQRFVVTALTLPFRYVPWNLHEQTRGKFDFSENLDLEYVVQILSLNTGGRVCVLVLGEDSISSF